MRFLQEKERIVKLVSAQVRKRTLVQLTEYHGNFIYKNINII